MSAWCVKSGSRIKAINEASWQARDAGWTGDEYANAILIPEASPGSYDQYEFAARFGNKLGLDGPPRRERGDRSLLLTPDQLKQAKQPRVIRRVNVPTVAAMTDDGPIFTTPVEAVVKDSPAGPVLHALKPGTGPGDEMLMPPELDPLKNAYGHKGRSGTNDAAACPDASVVSNSAFTLWSAEIDGTTRGIQINFGVKRPGTINPGNGFVIRRVSATQLEIFATNDDGEESNVGKTLRLGDVTLNLETGVIS